MFKDLSILQTATALARHAAERHSVISDNIANADTPGFKAKDLEPFAETVRRLESNKPEGFKKNESSALGAAKPNGNTVSLEDQIMRSAAASRDHGTAIAIYSKTIDILKTTLGRKG